MHFDLASFQATLITARAVDADMVWHPQTGGRTNHVWRVTGSQDLIVKLYDTSTQNPLYTNAPHAEYATLQALSGHQIAPDATALIQTKAGMVLVYHYIEGPIWSDALPPVARLLQHVWSIPVQTRLRTSSNGSDALIAHTKDILAHLPPDIARKVADAKPSHTDVAPIAPVFIHTDVVAGNLIDSPDGLRLIDWQCPAMGDPTTDMASFLSPAMQMIYGKAVLTDQQVSTFLDTFSDQTLVTRYHQLAPLFHWRMAAYCAWRADKGDADYAPAAQAELAALI